MAEFVDVLRQFDRMCKTNAGCFNCPLHMPDGVSDECSIGAFANNPERIERKVMTWAAEHPEPVYPTWFDYLLSIGAIPKSAPAGGVYQWIVESIKHNQIPEETAQKLGLEPKEG